MKSGGLRMAGLDTIVSLSAHGIALFDSNWNQSKSKLSFNYCQKNKIFRFTACQLDMT